MKKSFCILLCLLTTLCIFAQEKESVTCHVGDDISYSIKFDKDQVNTYTTTIIKAVIPHETGYIIKFCNNNNFTYEIYAEKGTEVYLDDQLVLKITELFPNGFKADCWADSTIRKDTSHK